MQASVIETAGLSDDTFITWMIAAEMHCGKLTKLSVFDFGDFAFFDAYEAGMSPVQAVDLMLEAEGFAVFA
jgi:hypothetical protein